MHPGVDAALDFLKSVESDAFVLEPLVPGDLSRCRELMDAYRDLNLGLADASVVAFAERMNLQRLLTVVRDTSRTSLFCQQIPRRDRSLFIADA